MIKHNELNPHLSLVECDQCGTHYALIEDICTAEHCILGCRLQVKGTVLYFCGVPCLKKFVKENEEWE